MRYNFDEIIDRRNTNCMNTDGFREYIFHADSSMQFPYKDEEFVRMWIADMEFATPEVIIDGIRARLDQRIFGYTKIFDPAYYEAFAAWTTQRYGWACEKHHLVTSPGIIPALYELVEFITKPDEKILISTPSYAYFKHAADHNHRQLVCSDLRNDGGYYTMDFEGFARKAQDPKVTLFILCNPHNPSGRVWTEEELGRMGQICRDNGVWIISDEIHCDLVRTGLRHTPMAKALPDYDKVITCMSPSKTFNMAGMMLSNVVIPHDGLRAHWKERHYDFENPLSVAAVQAAYAHGGEWLEQMKEYLDANFAFTQEFLRQRLPKARFRIPESTYLAWVDVSAYVPDDVHLPLYFANNAGVLLEGGNMFVQNSDGYIRLNLACPRATLATGLERIAGLLEKNA